jgi:hypothetical protein
VYSGQFSVPYHSSRVSPKDFVISVKLDRPFRWDPLGGPLIVDIRKQQAIGANDLDVCDSEIDPQVQRVVHTSDANATISNTSVQGSALVLQLGGHRLGNALATTYGKGCGGKGGAPTVATIGLPWLGNRDLAFGVWDAAPLAPASILFGLSKSSINLGMIGARSCTLLNLGELGSSSVLIGRGGSAVSPLPIPAYPGLDGARIHCQWVVLDPNAPANLALSAGLTAELRH